MKTFNVFFKILVCVFMVFVIILGSIFAFDMLRDDSSDEILTPPTPTPGYGEDVVVNDDIVVDDNNDEYISEDDFYKLIEIAGSKADEMRYPADSLLTQVMDEFEGRGYECEFYINAQPIYNENDMSQDMHMYAMIQLNFTFGHSDWEYGDEPTSQQIQEMTNSINYNAIINRVAEASDYEYVVVTLYVNADGFGYYENIFDGAKVYNNGNIIVETTYSDLSSEDLR